MTGGLLPHVSVIAPLDGALDGSVRKKRTERKDAVRPPTVVAGWVCPRCGRKSSDSADQARHVAQELYQTDLLLAELQIAAHELSAAIPEAEPRVVLARRLLTEDECRRAHAAWMYCWRKKLPISVAVLDGQREYRRRQMAGRFQPTQRAEA